jgi:hypothetical protein
VIEGARSSKSKQSTVNSFLEDLELTWRRWIALEARAATGAVGRCLRGLHWENQGTSWEFPLKHYKDLQGYKVHPDVPEQLNAVVAVSCS